MKEAWPFSPSVANQPSVHKQLTLTCAFLSKSFPGEILGMRLPFSTNLTDKIGLVCGINPGEYV